MLTRRQQLLFAGVTVTGAVLPLSLWVRLRGGARIRGRLEDLEPAPVAVVLGCLAHSDGTPSSHLEDRLAAALRLYHAGKVAKVVASGHADEVAAMVRWLRARDVVERDLLTDASGARTLATVRNLVAVFGIERAVLCTHRYHLPRTLYLAEACGLQVEGYVADRAPIDKRVQTYVREFAARAMAALDALNAQVP